MKKWYGLYLLGSLGFFSLPCLAAWHSGGGEFVQDAQNPWFVQNTTVLKACVVIDSEHFHLFQDNVDLVHDVIEPGIKYWEAEFAAVPPLGDDTGPRVATQKFEFGPCSSDTDLRFQFGTLTAEQLASFHALQQDPKNFVSLAVRTDYDRVHLKAKGFIYIAADSGPLRPGDPLMGSTPWAHAGNMRLRKVLAHELGHVYGVPHTSGIGSNGDPDIMDSRYPEAMARDSAAYMLPADLSPLPHFLVPATEDGSANCFDPAMPLAAKAAAFLAIDQRPDCLSFTRKANIISVEGSQGDVDGPSTLYGSLTLTSMGVPVTAQGLVSIWLPPQQVVFPKEAKGTVKWLVSRPTLQQIAEYHSSRDTVRRRALVTIFPGFGTILYGLPDSGDLIPLLEAESHDHLNETP